MMSHEKLFCALFIVGGAIACDSGPPAQAIGPLVHEELGDIDDAITGEERWQILLTPGEDLVVRVKWTSRREPVADEQPFGTVDVSLESNGIEASKARKFEDPITPIGPVGRRR